MKKSGKYFSGRLLNKWLLLALLSAMLAWLFRLHARNDRRCTPTYSLMQPGLLPADASKIAPFYLPFEDVYAFFKKQKGSKAEANINDWHNRICRKAKKEDLIKVIYHTGRSTLKLLQTALRSKSMSLPHELRGNSFAKYLRKNACMETIDYLLYAKACEPYVLASDAWEDEQKDTGTMQSLIEEGREAFAKCQSDYLRLRYLYQLMRLAHYMGDARQALQLYEELIPSILLPEIVVGDDYSVIYFWIQELRGGALQALGQRAKAAQLFAFCFLNRPECRASSFASFQLLKDEEWEQALALCTSDEERATLYAMRAQEPNSRALEEMQAIYQLKKCPDYLEVLLLKEIKELEQELLVRFYPYRKKLLKGRFRQSRPHPDVMSYLLDLRAFVHQVGKSSMALHPELWQIGEAYLFLLAGDYYETQKMLEGLRPQVSEPALARQLELLSVFATINSFDVSKLPTKPHLRREAISQIEAQAYELLTLHPLLTENPRLRQRNALRALLLDQMARFYEETNHPGLKFRCLYPKLLFLKLNPQQPIIEDLLNVIQEARKQELGQDSLSFRFRKALTRDTSGQNLAPLLYNLQGIISLQKFQLARAMEYFKQIPPAMYDDFGRSTPFLATYVDGDTSTYIEKPEADSTDWYNRYDFTQRLLSLGYEIDANIDTLASKYYELGVGLYNTTFFGHAWILRDEYRDLNNWNRLHPDSLYPYPGAPYGNIEMMNVRRPLLYFKKAMLDAQFNNDLELTAKAAYMAAKCEQVLYYQSKEFPGIPKGNVIPPVPDAYRTYFEKLRTELSETAFYTDLIYECIYFRNYVVSKDSTMVND